LKKNFRYYIKTVLPGHTRKGGFVRKKKVGGRKKREQVPKSFSLKGPNTLLKMVKFPPGKEKNIHPSQAPLDCPIWEEVKVVYTPSLNQTG